MPGLTIDDLPEEVHAKLLTRAKKAGRSVEDEAAEILLAVFSVDGSPDYDGSRLQAFVDGLYAGKRPTNVVEEFIAERRREAERE